MSKKAGNLAQELNEKNDERKSLIAEQIFNRKKVIDLEQFLSTTRALRLKEIHENELLKTEIKMLRDNSVNEEKENTIIKQNVIDKIIKIENVNSVNTNLNYTLRSQVEEIISLSREIIVIREKNNSLLEHVRKLEEVLTVYANQNDHLRREVEKGRKARFVLKNKNDELQGQCNRKNANKSINNNNNSSSNNNNHNGSNNGGTNTGFNNNNSFSGDYHPNASAFNTHMNSNMGASIAERGADRGMGSGMGSGLGVNDRAVSPSTTSYRGNTSFSSSYPTSHPSSFSPSNQPPSQYSPSPYSPSHSHSDPINNMHSTNGYDDGRHSHPNGHGETRLSTSQPLYAPASHPLPSLTSLTRQHKNNKKEKNEKATSRPDVFASHRSLFVGVGLGLKKQNMEEFNPQGSAKSVLKRIMKNFEYEDEVL